MSFPVQYDTSGLTEFDKLEKEVRGRDVHLDIRGISSNPLFMTVALGQDVAFAKVQLARKLYLDYNDIQFYLGDVLMFDPLSFADFPEILQGEATAKVVINVKVAK